MLESLYENRVIQILTCNTSILNFLIAVKVTRTKRRLRKKSKKKEMKMKKKKVTKSDELERRNREANVVVCNV